MPVGFMIVMLQYFYLLPMPYLPLPQVIVQSKFKLINYYALSVILNCSIFWVSFYWCAWWMRNWCIIANLTSWLTVSEELISHLNFGKESAYPTIYFLLDVMLGLIMLWAFISRFKANTMRLLLTWCSQAFSFQFLLMDQWPSPPRIFQWNGLFDLSFSPHPRMLSWIGTVSSHDIQFSFLVKGFLRSADSNRPALQWTCHHNIHIVRAW